MNKLGLAGALAAVALVSGSTVRADVEGCRAAIDHYNSAADEIGTALRTYARCVDDSRGHDDCTSEFEQLRSAQSDFEDAVSDYRTTCD